MSDVKAAVERLTENEQPYWGKTFDIRLVLSRLQALERECKAWRAWCSTGEGFVGWDDVLAARAATDTTEEA